MNNNMKKQALLAVPVAGLSVDLSCGAVVELVFAEETSQY